MDVRDGLAPRDPAAAARTAALLMMLGAGVAGVFAILQPPAGGVGLRVAVFAIHPALVTLGFVFRRASGSWPTLVWMVPSVIGIAAISGLDLATHDASAAGQIFFCFPVLYAGVQLRSFAAYLTAVLAIGADAVVVLDVEPATRALTDLAYVAATLICLAIVLARAGNLQERLVDRLRRQAAIDPLTGLVTRRVLDDAAQASLAGSRQDDGTALVLLDIDRFKSINDTYGHPVGDTVLVHVAGILSARTRSDTVVCRMGGDEIAVLLPGCPRYLAERRAEQLLEAVHSTPMQLADGTLVAISVSAGVAHVPPGAQALHQLYAAADAALYDAKRSGRGRVSSAAVPEAVGAESVAIDPGERRRP
jgi:diguanylate cyclase (GGDEF)-like protein